jgi:hypothetical protein
MLMWRVGRLPEELLKDVFVGRLSDCTKTAQK